MVIRLHMYQIEDMGVLTLELWFNENTYQNGRALR